VLDAGKAGDAGVGIYTYLLFVHPPLVAIPPYLVPMVHSPLYLFCRAMPSISKLLRDPAPSTSFKGYRLVMRFLELLRGCEEVTELAMAAIDSSLFQWLELGKACPPQNRSKRQKVEGY